MPDESDKQNASSEGHRERLRQRFLAGERGSMEDVALLELLLSYAIARRDVQPLAKSLIAKYGTLAAVLGAEPEALGAVKGIKDSSIALLKLMQHLRLSSSEAPREKRSPAKRSASPPSPKPIDPPAATAPAPADPVEPPEESPPTIAEPTDLLPPGERKLQISNGYRLDAAQLARILDFIVNQPDAKKKLNGAEMAEGSGLSARQVESLVSMGTALGLIIPRTRLLTPFGKLVARHDIFLDSVTTLEFCHFLAAGNPRHLVWYGVFNYLLPSLRPMTQQDWCVRLRERFLTYFSGPSLAHHVAREVRSILDTYLQQNFKKLNLVSETLEKSFVVRRYTGLQPLSLAAMIYYTGGQSEAGLVPFEDLHSPAGSVGRVFGLDSASLRQMVEVLHQRELLRFEVRHGLDQVRLIEGFQPLEFLAAAYENRAPQPGIPPVPPAPHPLLF